MNLFLALFCYMVRSAIGRFKDVDFEAINFAKALHGKKLNGSEFKEMLVHSEISCQMACVEETRCLSYNFGAVNKSDSLTCQLSDSDRFRSHANLTGDDEVLYRGIQVTNNLLLLSVQKAENRLYSLLSHVINKMFRFVV